ncbi:MAG TPA: hypothetical protein H9808_07450 [Candidatus Atopostipes pullistercoris]|uniref:Uncharacterized protein n=1 Tax=Candidatus Atopostipes pullistercoris TaxID=2838467 RepID=A0A9D2G225_9LACT|nr:hypothetical protein [Candidatus Atopostipes pullistercoris]
MRRINMYYEDIEYLLFTVKQNKNSIYDVGIDLKEREFRIETTDLYGHIQGTQIDGKLRRSSVKRFLSMLDELEFLSWPQRSQGILPLDLKNATVMYNIDGKMKYTTGNSTKDLAKLHKAIEQLVGTTFGTYKYY